MLVIVLVSVIIIIISYHFIKVWLECTWYCYDMRSGPTPMFFPQCPHICWTCMGSLFFDLVLLLFQSRYTTLLLTSLMLLICFFCFFCLFIVVLICFCVLDILSNLVYFFNIWTRGRASVITVSICCFVSKITRTPRLWIFSKPTHK